MAHARGDEALELLHIVIYALLMIITIIILIIIQITLMIAISLYIYMCVYIYIYIYMLFVHIISNNDNNNKSFHRSLQKARVSFLRKRFTALRWFSSPVSTARWLIYIYIYIYVYVCTIFIYVFLMYLLCIYSPDEAVDVPRDVREGLGANDCTPQHKHPR